MEAGRAEIRSYCRAAGIYHDIDGFENNPYPELNLRIDMNTRLFHGNSFVLQDFLLEIVDQFTDEIDVIRITFEDFCYFYERQIKFFDGCIIKRSDYSVTAGKSAFKWGKDRFDIIYFLRGLYNQNKLYSILDHYTDIKSDSGDIIYFRRKDGFIKLLKKIREGVSYDS
jgi:hypothetical protein